MRRSAILALFAALVIAAVPATAQVQAGTSELGVYAGKLFGDDLTDGPISGRTPELDDELVYGIRYGYNLSARLGVELSLGRSNSSTVNAPGGDVDLDVTTFDVDAVWHFNPESRSVLYLLGGVGYATAELDEPLTGTANGNSVTVDDDGGLTLNAGGGLKYFATEKLAIRAEARYRYLDQLVDELDDSLGTFETTLGVSWTF